MPPLLRLPEDLLWTIVALLPPASIRNLLLTARQLYHALQHPYSRPRPRPPHAPALAPVHAPAPAPAPAHAPALPSPPLAETLSAAAEAEAAPARLAELLEHGVSPDVPDAYGLTPLDHAARRGHDTAVLQLLRAGARLDARARAGPSPLFSPLELAAKGGHVSTLALLLAALHARFPPPEVADAMGRALVCAVQDRHPPVVAWLLAQPPPPSPPQPYPQPQPQPPSDPHPHAHPHPHPHPQLQPQSHPPPPPPPLAAPLPARPKEEALAKAIAQGATAIARLLLEAGTSANCASPTRPTRQLHVAAERNRAAIVQLLLDFGADVDLRDGLGLRALHYAVKGCAIDALFVLLRAGADIDCDIGSGSSGSGSASPGTAAPGSTVFGTPFSIALRRGWTVGVEAMARHGLAHAGWDARLRWRAVRQPRLRGVEEAFLRAVADVLGPDLVAVLRDEWCPSPPPSHSFSLSPL